MQHNRHLQKNSEIPEKIVNFAIQFSVQMSDLKEETTAGNTAEQVKESGSTRALNDTGLEGIQLFYEKNKQMVNYVGGGLVAIIAGILFFQLYYLPTQEAEAVNESFWAEKFFEKDSFNIALNGGANVVTADGPKQMMGFTAIADQYGMTRTGNLANYYAGVCLLRTGKFADAIDYLKKYSNSDQVIAPIAQGAIGDCYMELNQFDDAITHYQKAADIVDNKFTSPYFLKKLGFACELKGDYSRAVESYERIDKEYRQSTEARDIAKFIARAKAAGKL